MQRQVVHTDRVAPARVPLSQAIKVGGWVFASGQLGMEPRSGRLIEGGIGAETRQVCENLKAVLEAAGSSLQQVAKVTIYLADLGELMVMNQVLASAGSLGAVMVVPVIVVGTLVHLRFERRPESVV